MKSTTLLGGSLLGIVAWVLIAALVLMAGDGCTFPNYPRG